MRSGPEDDVRLACQALDGGDLPHALGHIALALAHDPLRREWLDLLDRIIHQAADVQSFVPVDARHRHFSLEAARAYVLADDGQYEEAVRLLLSVAAVKPEVPYLEWARGWLERPGVAETVEPALVAQFLWRWLEGGAERRELALPIAERASDNHPGDADLRIVRSSILRRCGRVVDALAHAEAAYRLSPDRMTAFMVGVALRALGRPADETVAWYRRALTYEPADVPVRLDLGDLLLEEGRLGEAAQTYDEVLALEPSNPWARASRCYVSHRVDPDGGARDTLQALADADPGNERAAALLAAIDHVPALYVDALPEPTDATINLLRSLVEKSVHARQGTLRVRLNVMEAPSARLALAEYARESELQVDLVIESVPSPDPRRAIAGGLSLWSYKGWPRLGTDVTPAVGPPPRDVATAVAAIAATRYRADEWDAASEAAALRLGPGAIPALQAVMVHPPPRPDGTLVWAWISRVQVAAALVIGRLSGGVDALIAVARGPIDWTTSAAIVALTEAARRDADDADDVRGIFVELHARIPFPGECCYERALVYNWQRLPGVSEGAAETLRQWRSRLDGRS